MRDHTKLRAFELADQVVMRVYACTASFPREELFGLTSQVRRAALSAASNIVEGCSRTTTADYVRYLEMAYGSAREANYQLSVAHRLGFLPNPGYQEVSSLSEESCKVLNALIRSLRDQD